MAAPIAAAEQEDTPLSGEKKQYKLKSEVLSNVTNGHSEKSLQSFYNK